MSETPAQRLERLLGSLEVLLDQESALITARNWQECLALEDRLMVVAEEISTLALELGRCGLLAPPVKARAEELISRHQASIAELSSCLQQTKEDLRAINQTQSRLQSLRPAYAPDSRQPAALSSFAAQG